MGQEGKRDVNGGNDTPTRVAWRIVGSEDMIGGVVVCMSAWQPMAGGVFTKCFSFRRLSD